MPLPVAKNFPSSSAEMTNEAAGVVVEAERSITKELALIAVVISLQNSTLEEGVVISTLIGIEFSGGGVPRPPDMIEALELAKKR